MTKEQRRVTEKDILLNLFVLLTQPNSCPIETNLDLLSKYPWAGVQVACISVFFLLKITKVL